MFTDGHLLATGASAVLCAVVQAIMMFGIVVASFSMTSYALDSFRNLSNEIFIMNMLFKVDQTSSFAMLCSLLTILYLTLLY
jgi:hypothetical protein